MGVREVQFREKKCNWSRTTLSFVSDMIWMSDIDEDVYRY